MSARPRAKSTPSIPSHPSFPPPSHSSLLSKEAASGPPLLIPTEIGRQTIPHPKYTHSLSQIQSILSDIERSRVGIEAASQIFLQKFISLRDQQLAQLSRAEAYLRDIVRQTREGAAANCPDIDLQMSSIEEITSRIGELLEMCPDPYFPPASGENRATQFEGLQEIHVKMPGEKTISLEVATKDTISAVKVKIQAEIGTPPSQQMLYLNGLELFNHLTVGKCQRQAKSTLQLMLRLSGGMQIFLKYVQTGQKVALDVYMSDTVRVLKSQIQAKEAISPSQYRLKFADIELKDDKTLSHYGILQESILDLSLRETFGIVVRAMTGKSTHLNVSSDETIAAVKEKIWEKDEIPPERQRLIYVNRPLDDQYTLSDYNISVGATIQLVYKMHIGLQLFVKSLNGKVIPLEVESSATVLDLKSKIREKVGIAPDQYRLSLSGRSLDDNLTLDQCKVYKEATLEMLLRIHIQTLQTGQTFDLDVPETESLESVRTRIQAEVGYMPCQQRLIYAGKVLEDGFSLKEYSISRDALLQLTLKHSTAISISVRLETDTLIPLTVDLSDTVEMVKGQIQGKCGLPQEQQRLFLADWLLENSQTLAACNIQTGSVLVVKSFIRVHITTQEKPISLNFEPSAAVMDVKIGIYRQEGVHPDQQYLLYLNQLLEDALPLAQLPLKPDSSLYLLLKRPGAILISVKMHIFAYVEAGDTVEAVRAKVRSEAALLPCQERLWIQGYQLEDRWKVGEYGIPDGAELDLA